MCDQSTPKRRQILWALCRLSFFWITCVIHYLLVQWVSNHESFDQLRLVSLGPVVQFISRFRFGDTQCFRITYLRNLFVALTMFKHVVFLCDYLFSILPPSVILYIHKSIVQWQLTYNKTIITMKTCKRIECWIVTQNLNRNGLDIKVFPFRYRPFTLVH